MGVISFVESVCVQTAVYWAPAGNNGFGKTFAAPVEISCRWDDVSEQVIDQQGQETMSKAKLLLTGDVIEGGFMYLGTLDDLDSSPQDPREFPSAYPIIQVLRTPLFRSSSVFVYECILGNNGR